MPIRSVPEHDLLVASSCRFGGITPTIERVLEGEIDWTYLTRICLQHRVAPSLLTALDGVDTRLVPQEFLETLRWFCADQHSKSLEIVSELFEILDALSSRGVRAVPFKGPLLGEVLFGAIGARLPGDIDLLVQRRDVSAVLEVLEAREYEDAGAHPTAPRMNATQRTMYERGQCEYQFVRPSDDMVVEPHWELSQRPLALDVDYDGMLQRAELAQVCGRALPMLAPEDLMLALCAHGAKHQWQRLSWIRDVAGVLARWPGLDWAALVARAHHRGCGRILMLGLAVAAECSNMQLEPGVARVIAADSQIAHLKSFVLSRIFDEHQIEPRNDRVDAFRLRLRERWSDRFKYAALTLVTPRRRHIELLPLPRLLGWAYYPIKIGLDFALIPARSAIWRSSSLEKPEKSSGEQI